MTALGAVLAPARIWLIGGAVVAAGLVIGALAWRTAVLADRAEAERSRADAAILRQGQLQATVDQLVATNMANVDAWARERADRARADAAALRADEAARATAGRYESLKREIRRAVPPDLLAGPGVRAAFDGLRRRPSAAGGGDAGTGGAAADPARPAALP